MNENFVDDMSEQRARLQSEADQILNRSQDDNLTGPDLERFNIITTSLERLNSRADTFRAIGSFNASHLESGSGGDLDRDPIGDPRDIGHKRSNPWDGYIFGRTAPVDVQSRALSAFAQTPGMTDGQRQAATQRLEAAADPGVAELVLATTDPDYVAGFSLQLRGDLDLASPEERAALRRGRDVARSLGLERAMSQGTTTAGGYLVPESLDPHFIIDAAGATSPIRSLARRALVSTKEHTFITSSAVTSSWDAEAAEVSDDTPTLAEVVVPTHGLRQFVPYSIELEMNAGGNLTGELQKLFVDAKNTAEASAFVTGSGSGQPKGWQTSVVATSTYLNASAGTDAFAIGDVYSTYEALDVRHRDSATWICNELILDLIRQFGSADSHSFLSHLDSGAPARILGRPVATTSVMDGTITAATENYVLGLVDFKSYGIVDRVGLTVEHIPNIMGANQRPTGQRGLFAYSYTGADVLVDRAYSLLNVT